MLAFILALFGLSRPYPCFGPTPWEREYSLAFYAPFRAPTEPPPTVIVNRPT